MRQDEPERIDSEEPFQALIFEEVSEAESSAPIEANEMLVSPYAVEFCWDGEKWIQ